MEQGIYCAFNMENICKEFQRVYSGTSDWFIPEPPQKLVQY